MGQQSAEEHSETGLLLFRSPNRPGEATTGFEHSVHFLEHLGGAGQVMHRQAGDDGIKGPVVEGELLGVRK